LKAHSYRGGPDAVSAHRFNGLLKLKLTERICMSSRD